MADDKLKFGDAVDVSLSQEVVPPAHPCPTCGVETKDTGINGWRLCTDCNQRLYVGLTEQQHLMLLDDIQGAKARCQQYELMYKQTDAELTQALRTMRERGLI